MLVSLSETPEFFFIVFIVFYLLWKPSGIKSLQNSSPSPDVNPLEFSFKKMLCENEQQPRMWQDLCSAQCSLRRGSQTAKSLREPVKKKSSISKWIKQWWGCTRGEEISSLPSRQAHHRLTTTSVHLALLDHVTYNEGEKLNMYVSTSVLVTPHPHGLPTSRWVQC